MTEEVRSRRKVSRTRLAGTARYTRGSIDTILGRAGVLWALALAACKPEATGPLGSAGDPGSIPLVDAGDAPMSGTFCALPGSVVSTASGPRAVPGGEVPNLGWLHLPVGFCAHYFGTVHKARQLRFSPDGALFVASPSQPTTGGAIVGDSSIVSLRDDNHDGTADTTVNTNITFLDGLPSVQGLMFHAGHLYYQDAATIRRVPYQPGDRKASMPSEVVTEMMGSWTQDALHWPKVFDVAQDGTIYITNGSSQLEACTSARAPVGVIVKLNPDGTTSQVAKGFRNPIALHCETDHDVCLAIELALDYSNGQGGREKLLPVRPGDDWGFPCCAAQNLPYSGVSYADTGKTPDCSGVAAESDAFIIGHTPFGLDIEPGAWPQTSIDGSPGVWNGRVFITLHGDYSSWSGARVVAVALDPNTGLPLPASELGTPGNNLVDFATGWDDGTMSHGRPAPIVFAPDGRMFVGDDQLGTIIWIAPVGLKQP